MYNSLSRPTGVFFMSKDDCSHAPFYQIHPADNVAVALCDTEVQGVVIPAGHKAAVTDIASGQPVIKYGFPIGLATAAIPKGAHVHTHNLRSSLNDADDSMTGRRKISSEVGSEVGRGIHSGINSGGSNELSRGIHSGANRPLADQPTFMGYRRSDGRVGIRNEIWVINTVGCINGVAEAVAAEANRRFAGQTDGVIPFTHPLGCSQTGADHANTQKIISALVLHPNAGGVLVLGLGCENNYIDSLRTIMGETDPERVRFLQLQDAGDEREAALSHIASLVALLHDDIRVPVPISELTVGLKCGGSDGFSGITANPLLGRVSDRLVAMGGTVLLSEVPEMFGAEGMLYGRCATPALRQSVVALIDHFKQYYRDHGEPVDENPSPGNRAGGITTLAEKSLGCTQKGGTGEISGVIAYGERVTAPGLHLLESPGNDMVSTTALAAAGAHMILFTTGRGTPYGSVVPTVKISSNTALYQKKPNWIDLDAGVLAGAGNNDGDVGSANGANPASGSDMEAVADRLFTLVMDIASGSRTMNEINDCRDMAVWKNGVTL